MKFENHLGKPVEVEINGDKFEFKPLTVAETRKLMLASLLMERSNNEKDLDKATSLLFEIVDSVVKRSYPEVSNQYRDSFIASNFAALFNILPELAGLPNIDKDLKNLGLKK